MSGDELIAAIEKLSVDERLDLIGRIQDSLDRDLDAEPTPERLKNELERRHQEYLANPDSYLTWDEVRRVLREKHEP